VYRGDLDEEKDSKKGEVYRLRSEDQTEVHGFVFRMLGTKETLVARGVIGWGMRNERMRFWFAKSVERK